MGEVAVSTVPTHSSQQAGEVADETIRGPSSSSSGGGSFFLGEQLTGVVKPLVADDVTACCT
jgi:hypothetical protein